MTTRLKLSELKADFIDEHCYAAPDWFLDNAHRYDAYDRSGPKVFMGEYAAQSVADGLDGIEVLGQHQHGTQHAVRPERNGEGRGGTVGQGGEHGLGRERHERVLRCRTVEDVVLHALLRGATRRGEQILQRTRHDGVRVAAAELHRARHHLDADRARAVVGHDEHAGGGVVER